MEKEQVKKFDLEAAFKALDEIEIPAAEKGIKANRVNFKEALNQVPAHEALIEDYFNIGDSEALEEAQDEREGEVAQAKLQRIEKIVDLDAETADDLLPSYVGKYVIQCPQCMTLFYKNKEDIDYSEENPDVVNINEVCQHCGNTSGYTLIGKVDAVDNSEADNYSDEAPVEENPLDLDFDTEAAEGEEVPEETPEETPAEESEEDVDLNLEDLPDEEEEKNESLNLSKEAPSENETEHKSENLTLNEEAANESLNNSEVQKDAEEGSELKTENESENLTLNEEKICVKDPEDENKVIEVEVVNGEAQMPNGEKKPVAECKEELTEDVDKDLDKKLKAHNDYIAFVQTQIKETEEALKAAENDEIKDALQRRLDSLNVDLESALPDAVKGEPVIAQEESALTDEAPVEEPVDEAPVDEAPAEETPVEETPVEEQLTEEAPAAEEPAANTVNYVDYKHSYCHILQPMLKKINYLCNVLGDDKADLEKCKNVVLNYLKKAPELKYTHKEQEFFDNVKAVESKRELYDYIKNSINKAKELEVKVDENGELVEGLNEGFEPVEESLNKSEEAPSDFETENGSENLTLNESLTEAAQPEDISAALTNFIDNLETPAEAPVEAPAEGLGENLNEGSDLDSALVSFIDSLPENLEESTDLNEADYNVSDAEFRQLIHSKAFNEAAEEAEPIKEELPPSSVVDKIVDRINRAGEDVEEDLKEESETEACKDGECEKPLEECSEKPLEECGEKPLKEEAEETPAEEEAPADEPVEEPTEDPVEEEPVPNPEEVNFTTDEVKEVATDVAQALATPVKDEEEAEEQAEEIAEVVDEKVDAAVEEKVEEANEGEESEEAAEEPDIEGEPANDLEFDEESVDDLDECSLNKHIDEYLKEVYSNVKCFEATGCRFTEGKLMVEGKISFNSGKEKLTMFEFLPAYGEGKLFFEGYNKDFSEDKAFTLNCSINESKTLITESFGYKYKINENLVEGLK